MHLSMAVIRSRAHSNGIKSSSHNSNTSFSSCIVSTTSRQKQPMAIRAYYLCNKHWESKCIMIIILLVILKLKSNTTVEGIGMLMGGCSPDPTQIINFQHCNNPKESSILAIHFAASLVRTSKWRRQQEMFWHYLVYTSCFQRRPPNKLPQGNEKTCLGEN